MFSGFTTRRLVVQYTRDKPHEIWMGASLQCHADMSVDMDHPEMSYSDIMSQEGVFGGSLEAHVAGLVLGIEIFTHNASTSSEIFRVGCEGETVVNRLYDAVDVHYDGLEPFCS